MLTLAYAAPERLNKEDYAMPYDMWGIGCILYELCCLKRPFGDSVINIIRVKFDREPLKHIEPLYKELIEQVLVYEPKSRLTISEFCNKLNSFDLPKDDSLLSTSSHKLIGKTAVFKFSEGLTVIDENEEIIEV